MHVHDLLRPARVSKFCEIFGTDFSYFRRTYLNECFWNKTDNRFIFIVIFEPIL